MHASRTQRKAIRTYVQQGLSTNKIQKRLQKQHLGIRRKTLLAEVRKIKGTKPKADRFKYTPRKYRKRPPKARKPVFIGKHIAVYGYARAKRHPKPYSARFEFHGRGKGLFKAVKLANDGIVPCEEYPFVECNPRNFLSNPYKYGESGVWAHKDVKS